MKTNILHIIYDLRHQAVISWITLLATALTVCLLLVYSMIQSIHIVPFAPESCRPRLLAAPYIHILGTGDNGVQMSGAQSYTLARQLCDSLPGVELLTIKSDQPMEDYVTGPSGDAFTAKVVKTDANFFKVFDHTLLAGRYYTAEEADALVKEAVVSESTARRLWGAEPEIGGTFEIHFVPYRLIGIIKDHSPHATIAHGDIFIPTGAADTSNNWNEYLGEFGAYMLLAPGASEEHVRDALRGRYADLNTQLAPQNMEAIYHQTPFNIDELAVINGNSSGDLNMSKKRAFDYTVYAILLLVPAINLSSMLHSRMRRRVSEMGVRRAFGCTRSRLIVDIILENLLVTFIGAVVGLVAAIVVGLSSTTLFAGFYGETPPLSALLSWHTVVASLIATITLNILSASIPAWKASRLNPVEAINNK